MTSRPIDATGTRRRLQALAADGWSLRSLAEQLGMSHVNITKIVNTRAVVTPATAVAVAILYRMLANQPPAATTRAERISAAKARAHASAHGWVVADGWDDDEIDDPAAAPYLPGSVVESKPRRPARPRSGDGVEKRCSDCRDVKLVAEYARNRTKVDGRHNLCKDCQKQRRQQRQNPAAQAEAA